ncbi:TetR/AcrR family transcriptional regulator [Streptomyces cylindrosporus]|uniref:TetR family transcriptional regulator n=1 Tax=Streptomyces cylindrosporus TaxID=2927583 RepID=A0ABS9YN05_9ACTN|nr:TetR family transcriptional regulator [Streptomyces cylindrosporus]MCI3277961.1 TetR family transcriptional regulator [Streptomyces cylindrosporus]
MQPRTPKIGRPARLSHELIVATAMQSDLATLTMRELAGRLGVSHSALYRWVADRDQLLDLISETMVERILPEGEPTEDSWRDWLAELAWSMHDQFLAVPGYATHVARPHRHNAASFARLRDRVVGAFRVAGCDETAAEQSWTVYGLSVVQWVGAVESAGELHGLAPRFDLFLDVLLRGLPVRPSPGRPRPPA